MANKDKTRCAVKTHGALDHRRYSPRPEEWKVLDRLERETKELAAEIEELKKRHQQLTLINKGLVKEARCIWLWVKRKKGELWSKKVFG